MGDLGWIPELERSPGEGKGYHLQYSGLENAMGYIANGAAKSWTRLTDCLSFMTHLRSFVPPPSYSSKFSSHALIGLVFILRSMIYHVHLYIQ